MPGTLSEYRRRVDRLEAERDDISERLRKAKLRSKEARREQRHAEKAQAIIRHVALETQRQLEYEVNEVVSLALSAVFNDPYEFRIVFEEKRGKTECRPVFVRDGEEMNPMDSCGFGAVDVAAFGAQVALWALRRPRSRNTLALDEPFRHLKGEEANRRAIQMVKEVSRRLGLQVIMISDERVPIAEIEKGADKVFEVRMRKGTSKVRRTHG